jgi:REP element-mobilizing transposase RayT
VPRPLRTGNDGDFFHVSSRGNRRGSVFHGDSDRALLAALLNKTVPRYAWICHAFAFLGNHFHLLVETPTFNLSAGMQYLNGRYAQIFNHHHSYSGHVFEGRFKSKHVESESHLLECCRYIALNPVRAGLVRRPERWPWSSYRATAGIGPRAQFLTVDTVLALFDDDVRRARAAYRKFVADGLTSDVAGV